VFSESWWNEYTIAMYIGLGSFICKRRSREESVCKSINTVFHNSVSDLSPLPPRVVSQRAAPCRSRH
jgi:hypothetical protein